MKNHKNDFAIIFNVLAYFLICVIFSTIDNPILHFVLSGLWITYLSYNLYYKFQYRKGKSDYIVFPTQNDQYSKITSITLGPAIFILSVSAIAWAKSDDNYAIIGVMIGLLIFLNGLFDLQKGFMKIKSNFLIISGVKNNLDIRLLREIKIDKERIILTNIYDETSRVENLAISPDSAELIERYISERKNHIELTIVNNVR